MISFRPRQIAEEFGKGALVSLCAGGVGVLISTASGARLDAALLAALVGCGGRGLPGQAGALLCSIALGTSLGGVHAGFLALATGVGFAVSFSDFARSSMWSLMHARAASRFALATGITVLIGQLLKLIPSGPVIIPTALACGLVLCACVGLEMWRAVRASERRSGPRRVSPRAA